MLYQVGLKSLPRGRVGNLLFVENVLRQIEKTFGIPSFHIRKGLKGYVKRESFLPLRNPRRFDKEISAHELKQMNRIQLKQYISEFDFQKNNLIIPGELLGDFYSQFTFHPPRDMFKIGHGIATKSVNKEHVEAAIHFRGKDFFSWNINAILTTDFYMNAIDYIESKCQGIKIEWTVHTDDETLESFKHVCERLSINYKPSAPIRDFRKLARSDFLVCSPSTFCIWASFLNPYVKEVIHNYDWVKRQSSEGDKFWNEILIGELPYYLPKLI